MNDERSDNRPKHEAHADNGSEHVSTAQSNAAPLHQEQPQRTSDEAPSHTSVSLADDSSAETDAKEEIRKKVIRVKKLPFYHGGVRPKHVKFVRVIGQCGFIAKGVVYGIIGVLIMTNVSGTYTPNGSQGNESPQGAFLLLGGIPAIGRPILVVMAVGLGTYLCWRFWEAITGQAMDAALSRRTNFFRYRLSPIVSGCVYIGYLYYLIQMIYQTEEEQQRTASSNEFPASWTDSTVGSAFVGIFGLAFMIAFVTQMVNAVTGNFIPDLKTGEPTARKWEARIVHMFGRVGFGGRAAMFGTLSGFFWESLAERNESGEVNVIAAAIGKLSVHPGGLFFMVILGLSLIIYGIFAIANAHYKYFPTPPPSRIPLYELVEDDEDVQNGQEQHDQEHQQDDRLVEQPKRKMWWRRLWMRVHPSSSKEEDVEKQESPQA